MRSECKCFVNNFWFFQKIKYKYNKIEYKNYNYYNVKLKYCENRNTNTDNNVLPFISLIIFQTSVYSNTNTNNTKLVLHNSRLITMLYICQTETRDTGVAFS